MESVSLQSYKESKNIGTSFSKYNVAKSKVSVGKKIALLFSGALIGVVNGLFGAGGGMITVPVLTYILGLDEKKSHATAIAIILPLCIITTMVYAIKTPFEYDIIAPTVIGVVIGAIIGSIALKKISNNALTIIFYGIMLFAGLRMIFDQK